MALYRIQHRRQWVRAYVGTLNYDEETGHIYDEEGDVVDEDTIASFLEGDGKGDDEDE